MKVIIAALLCLAAVASAKLMATRHVPNSHLDAVGAALQRNFDCSGRPSGYYADVATDCQFFHQCVPIVDHLGEVVANLHFSFMCARPTIFNQETHKCVDPDEDFQCGEA